MQAAITKTIEEVGSVLLGKEQQIKLASAIFRNRNSEPKHTGRNFSAS
jgi:hypothetical protein